MSDWPSLLYDSFANLALLISLTFAYGLLIQKLPAERGKVRPIIDGLLFGIVAVVGMLLPLHIADGIIIDGRTVIVMLSGVFAGPLAGLVAGAIVSAFRFYLGGVGTVAGIGAILTAMAIGIAIRSLFLPDLKKLKFKHLLAMSIVMTAASLLWVFALPPAIDAAAILAKLLLPVGVLYPVGTICLGLMMSQQYRRVRLEAELKESEARYRRLFMNAEISIWNEDLSHAKAVLDEMRQDGIANLRAHLNGNPTTTRDIADSVKVTAVNDATLKLFGASNFEALPDKITETFGPGALDVFKEQLCAIWDNQTIFRAETNYRTLDGRDLTCIISLPLSDQAAEYSNIPVSVVDVTEFKKMEDRLRQSKRMEAIGQLTGGIAHDFNNILGIILGNLQLLRRRIDRDEKTDTLIDAALAGTQRGADITRKLLSFTSHGTGGAELTDLKANYSQLEDLIKSSLTAAYTVTSNLETPLWPVRIDPGDFQDAMLNLVLNARDAMPGGGTITIEMSNKTLDEKYAAQNPDTRAGDYVQISVVDTGTGMTNEVKERLFEPFFTTKDVGKGTGLGLSMVYGFVERSGGHMTVFSELGRGTRFHLYLPRALPAKTETEAPAASTNDTWRGDETILIVDDEPDLREIAVDILEGLGYATMTATGGADALKILGDHPETDLVFCDFVLPGNQNGRDIGLAARQLKPQIKVLLTSGFPQNGGPMGVDQPDFMGDILQKPYGTRDLAKAVRRVLDGASP